MSWPGASLTATSSAWGNSLRRETRQWDAVGEQLFELLERVVAPLALLEPAPNSDEVVVTLQGAELPKMAGDARGVRPGDAFLPIWRRTSRTGELLPKGGIQPVPWTFVETTTVNDDGSVIGRVASGLHRPLSAHRRGRVEQLGIALRDDPAETTIRIVARTKPDQPLAGCTVLALNVDTQNKDNQQETELGETSRDGSLAIPPGAVPLRMLLVKNGSVLLARVPIVSGYRPLVVVPVADDGIRLAAETRLAALREELIDLVARRNILMARTRRKIEAGDFKEAHELLIELDQLPGRSYFNQELARQRRLYQSPDQRAAPHRSANQRH